MDRAWLLMERPTNPMMIVGVVVLGGRLPLARLRQLVGERFMAFDRFRCRPVSEALAAHWTHVDHFELNEHVVAVALPAPASQPELESLVGDLAGTPFNVLRPWWSFHLVERYGRGSAIIVRIHHCYADGLALVRVLLGLADATAGTGGAAPPAPRHEASTGLVSNVLREGSQLIQLGLRYALHPLETIDAAAGAAADAAGAFGELVNLALLADDPPTVLKRPLSGSRRVAWASPLRFDSVKALGAAFQCTINDVLIATLAGALGHHLRERGQRLKGLTLHAAVPVNLRPENDPLTTLGNRFGLVFVELPVGIKSPRERVRRVHESMRALKGSSQAMMTFALLAAVGSLPEAVENTAIEVFTAKASLVVSNVPGPREAIRIGGVKVGQLLFWVPQAGSIGTGISLLSYDGHVQFGVMADRRLIPEPSQLTAAFTSEFERLVSLASPPAAPGSRHAARAPVRRRTMR